MPMSSPTATAATAAPWSGRHGYQASDPTAQRLLAAARPARGTLRHRFLWRVRSLNCA